MVLGIDHQIEKIEAIQKKAEVIGEDAFVNTLANTLRGLYVAKHQHEIRTHQAVHKDAVRDAIQQITMIFARHVATHVPDWPGVARLIHTESTVVLDALENSKQQQVNLDCKRTR